MIYFKSFSFLLHTFFLYIHINKTTHLIFEGISDSYLKGKKKC